MKTIGTCLPVYNRKEKQSYERAKASHFDKVAPVMSPQWRLPSMQWNVEVDDPEEIEFIEFYDVNDTLQYNKDSGFYGWMNRLAAWDTFTISGLDITLATQVDNADAYAVCRNTHPDTGGIGSGSYMAKAGETIHVTGTYTHISGAVNRLCIFDAGWVEDYGENLVTGTIDFTYTFLVDGEVYLLIHQPAWLASSFSFTNVTVGISGGVSIFSTTDSYIQVIGGGSWNDGGTYDTFTLAGGATDIAQAEKTTAAGEAYCQNVVTAGSVPTTLAVGEKLRIFIDLTMTGGDVPKIELRDTVSGLAISNTVTLADGDNYVILTATDDSTAWAITIYNSDTETCDWAATFRFGEKTVVPTIITHGSDEYFIYNGETLSELLDEGIYYLKITTYDGFVYYSDYFKIDCIYPNLINAWTNIDYNTFTSSGVEIISAIETGASGGAYSTSSDGDTFHLIAGEEIRVIFFFTLNSGQFPEVRLYSTTLANHVDHEHAVAGLNDFTLTATIDDDYRIRLSNGAASNFSITDVLVMRDYSEKYIRIVFSNTCDLGDIVYHDGFEQTLWLETEPMENTYPLDEEGAKDGEGKFIRSFGRQVKKYIARTKELPSYIVEVLYRMILHDSIELTDLVGDVNTVQNLEVEHEWLWEDKYYAKADLTFDYDEAFVIGGCCNNIS